MCACDQCMVLLDELVNATDNMTDVWRSLLRKPFVSAQDCSKLAELREICQSLLVRLHQHERQPSWSLVQHLNEKPLPTN